MRHNKPMKKSILAALIALFVSHASQSAAIQQPSVNLDAANCATKNNQVSIFGATVINSAGVKFSQDIFVNIGIPTAFGAIDLMDSTVNYSAPSGTKDGFIPGIYKSDDGMKCLVVSSVFSAKMNQKSVGIICSKKGYQLNFSGVTGSITENPNYQILSKSPILLNLSGYAWGIIGNKQVTSPKPVWDCFAKNGAAGAIQNGNNLSLISVNSACKLNLKLEKS